MRVILKRLNNLITPVNVASFSLIFSLIGLLIRAQLVKIIQMGTLSSDVVNDISFINICVFVDADLKREACSALIEKKKLSYTVEYEVSPIPSIICPIKRIRM